MVYSCSYVLALNSYAQFQEWTTSKVNELIILFLAISTDVSILIMTSYACAFVSAYGMNPNHSVIAKEIAKNSAEWRVVLQRTAICTVGRVYGLFL